MATTITLSVILILLMIIIGGERGSLSLVTLGANIIIFIFSIVMIYFGLHPIVVAFIGCFLISMNTIFFQNGKNPKMLASFISVTIIMVLLSFVVYRFSYTANISGINEILKRQDEMMGLSVDININMVNITVALIMFGLIGALIDGAIAIATAVYEVYNNNKYLSSTELIKSGISMGKDIIGTMINTLFFAYIGESIMLFIFYSKFNYNFLQIINSKAFVEEFASIIISGAGSVLIIPVTSVVIAYILNNQEKFSRYFEEEKEV